MEKKKISKTYSTPFEVAFKYFSIVIAINSIKLKNRELELLAFTAIKGTISTGGAKHEFITQFGSSMGTIGNIIHVLSKKRLLIKQNKKYVINPVMNLDFSNSLSLQINLNVTREDS